MKLFLSMIVLALVSQVALGAEEPAKPQGPPAECKAVWDACEKAGFKNGAAKDGIGLFNHCIKPLVTNSKQPPNAKKKLPKGVKKASLDKCLAAMPDLAKK